MSCFTLAPSCDSFKVTRSSTPIVVQLYLINYVCQIKTLSKDIPDFYGRDWLKNERDNEVDIRYSMSMTKYSKCKWEGLWSIKWMRIKINDKMNEIDFDMWNE